MVKVILLLVLMFSTSFAQFTKAETVVEDDSTKISSSAPKIRNSKKSVKDVLLSLVIPGWSFFG